MHIQELKQCLDLHEYWMENIWSVCPRAVSEWVHSATLVMFKVLMYLWLMCFPRYQADTFCSTWWQKHQRWRSQAWSWSWIPGIEGWGGKNPSSPQNTHASPTKKILYWLALLHKSLCPLKMLYSWKQDSVKVKLFLRQFTTFYGPFLGTLYFEMKEPTLEQN